jgi:methanogenic corrinoid protein MtbC1
MIRADQRTAHVRVLVGGRPFSLNPGLAARLGADGWAPDAISAVALCQEWAGELVARDVVRAGSRRAQDV